MIALQIIDFDGLRYGISRWYVWKTWEIKGPMLWEHTCYIGWHLADRNDQLRPSCIGGLTGNEKSRD